MDAEPLLRLRFAADPHQLRMVRERVDAAARGGGCSPGLAGELVIAVNEACMNIMQHAYKGDVSGEIVLEVRRSGDEIEVALRDFAAPVDVSGIEPRRLDDLRPGGLGTHFMRSIMDECQYSHVDGPVGNLLRMRKRIG